jgi:hypothetical protein
VLHLVLHMLHLGMDWGWGDENHPKKRISPRVVTYVV